MPDTSMHFGLFRHTRISADGPIPCAAGPDPECQWHRPH